MKTLIIAAIITAIFSTSASADENYASTNGNKYVAYSATYKKEVDKKSGTNRFVMVDYIDGKDSSIMKYFVFVNQTTCNRGMGPYYVGDMATGAVSNPNMWVRNGRAVNDQIVGDLCDSVFGQ